MKKYPKYKESGVEWLGDIPSDWRSIKLKFLMQIRNGEGLLADKITDYGEFEVIGGNGILGMTDRYNVDGTTIAIGRVGAKCGNVHFFKRKVFVNDNAMIAKTTKKAVAEFLVLSLDIMNLNNLSTSTAQPLLTSTAIKNQFVTLGSKEEQLSIVQFLDHKTGQIDRFIANRQKQIELLKEQKAAIINKAVTKGINTNAKMKDSGIEWIGEVPEHWEIWKLKFFADVVLGKMLNNDAKEGYELKPYLKASNVYWEKITVESIMEMYFSKNEMKRFRLKKGDLLINEGGEVGRSAIWNDELNECYIQNSVHKISFKNDQSEFYLYLMMTYAKKDFFGSIVNQVSIAHLTREKLVEIPFPRPCKEEQKEILKFLKSETTTIDTLITKYQKQIDLMQEYRTALISQAVTGKIDVRDWKPKVKKYKTEAIPMGMAAEKTTEYKNRK